jgi:hypothetical protein
VIERKLHFFEARIFAISEPPRAIMCVRPAENRNLTSALLVDAFDTPSVREARAVSKQSALSAMCARSPED